MFCSLVKENVPIAVFNILILKKSLHNCLWYLLILKQFWKNRTHTLPTYFNISGCKEFFFSFMILHMRRCCSALSGRTDMQTDFVPSVRSKFPSAADQGERSLWERDWHVRGEGGGLYVHGPSDLLCAGKRPESPHK